ncbi:hypothetical protein ACT4R9_11150 [Ornithobacterium rhinotracheale]|uniref:hypothetical protein n=1 Tax=Ornithobacterium rhinotracheale TaxID=28251 RepID=UPI003FA42CAD
MTFSKEWWNTFLNINDSFKRTCVIENVLSEEDLINFNKAVRNALMNKLKSGEKGGFRLYFPEKNISEVNIEFKNKMFDDPISEDESIESYCNRLFKQKFGIIFNASERYSSYISENLIKITKPLTETIGLPVAGMHATIFIGNYGWTPLGIHQDHRGANVIHFHLGPGRKKMYIWEEKKYDALTGTKHNNHDVIPLLKYAEEFDFGPGDLYFMPWNQFHIGKSDDFSIGITFWFNNPTKISYLNNVFNTFFTQYVDNKNKDIINPNLNYLHNNSNFEDLLSTINLEEKILNLKFKDFLFMLYDEYKKGLMSNCGWEASPITYEKTKGEFIEERDLSGKKIKLTYPFKIISEKDDDTFRFYVRGYKMEIKYHVELSNIIDKLNSFDTQLVDELLENLCDSWPKEAGLYFLSMIYDKKGLQIVD